MAVYASDPIGLLLAPAWRDGICIARSEMEPSAWMR